uniref:MARVEL domain containing 3 n=1 Tax=Leptobrachium leishanense TaxID=445787 RepID=A0A8C5QLN0_9ANUR
MGEPNPYRSDGESRAPRQHRSQPRSDHRAAGDSTPKTPNGQDKEERHAREHNERPPRKSHGERGPDRYQERDRYHEGRAERSKRDVNGGRHHDTGQYDDERNTSKNQRDRREQHPKEREHGRHRPERSHDRYEESKQYRSQEERGYSRYEERDVPYKDGERYLERDWHQHTADRPQRHPMDIRDKEPYVKAERSFSNRDAPMDNMEYYEAEPDGGILNCHKCKYLCTGRAFCQMVEALLNMLILVCCSVSYNSTGGFTGITNMGGIYYYQFGGAYSGFSGADGEKAQTLDVQFYQLKLPTVTASMAFGGALMAFSCLLLLLGVLRVPWHFPFLLLVECALDIAIAVGYIPALYFYIINLQRAYDSQVCKDRESLYSSKGYKGFTCGLHGADIASTLFACMAVIAFLLSAVLAVKGFLRVRRLKKEPQTTLIL